MVRKGGDLGSDEINVGHCAWPCSITTEVGGLKPIGIKVAIEIFFSSILSSEAEENDQYDDEETNSTSDHATSDGSHIRTRTRSATRVWGLCREDELGGTNCLCLDLAILIGGPGYRNKTCERTADAENKGAYTIVVLKTKVEVVRFGARDVVGVPSRV